jgi:hypothetical protein
MVIFKKGRRRRDFDSSISVGDSAIYGSCFIERERETKKEKTVSSLL